MDIVDQRDTIFDSGMEIVHGSIDDHGSILFLICESKCSITTDEIQLVNAHAIFPTLERLKLIELKIELRALIPEKHVSRCLNLGVLKDSNTVHIGCLEEEQTDVPVNIELATIFLSIDKKGTKCFQAQTLRDHVVNV